VSVKAGRQSRTDLPNRRQFLQVSETCVGGEGPAANDCVHLPGRLQGT
jgi:hypothetical protein